MWDETYQGYGPRNVWKPVQREGFRVARCTVGRLLRAIGLRGAVRGRAWITTTHAGDAAESALGVGLHLRRDLWRLRVRRRRD